VFFHLKLLTTNIFFQSLLICIFEISIQFYGGTCGEYNKTSYYEEANKNNDNGGNREIKKKLSGTTCKPGIFCDRWNLMAIRYDGQVDIRYRD
jgi:hypothetical protein